jgi:nucleoid-associated protein YgaU
MFGIGDKASLSFKDQSGEQLVLRAMFNPERLAIEKGTVIDTVTSPGSGTAVGQVTGGTERTMNVDLLFDTYELGIDVRRAYLRPLAALLNANSAKGSKRPECKFAWGSFTFDCMVEHVSEQFTLFHPTGVPARAMLALRLRELPNTAISARLDETLEVLNVVRTRAVQLGETLAHVAATATGDPKAWRDIARANGIANPRTVAPSTILSIPPRLSS